MQEQKSNYHSRTKVLLAITKGIWGGAQEYVWSLATSLPKEKFDVSVICGEGETLIKRLEENGVKTIQIKSLKRDIFFWNELKSFWTLFKTLKEEKPDILHLNSSKMGFLGGLVGRILGIKKIIFTAHGWAFNESRKSITKFLFYILQWLTVTFSHITITVSRKTKSDIDRMPLIKNKVFVIHNGIESIIFDDKEKARKKISEITKTKPVNIIIGTISELHKNKGLDFLIQACKNLPESVSVYIIGDGEERQNMANLIANFGLEERIFLTGRIENAKSLLPAFDLFTLTSRTEALPYTILEAGLAKLPVVASRVGGIPEVIENGKSGILFRSGDVDELTKALKYLIEREEKRKQFGENLQKTVQENFSKEKMLEKTIGFYLN